MTANTGEREVVVRSEAAKAEAARLGFERVGVAKAETLGPEGERLRAWLAAGKHGDMAWLADTAEVRIDPTHAGMLPGAASVVVVAVPYAGGDTWVGPSPGRVAKYARGRDYHNVIGKRLRRLAGWFRDGGFAARAAVDSMPVFERAWAERAGLGFIGKNSCLIVPGLGSHVFLGAVVTTAPLVPDAPMRERCGSCRLCLDGCPTRAFDGPRDLDARRCISYLTIEGRGAVPAELREAMGEWLFGCDACQDVCPFNRGQGHGRGAWDAFQPDGRWKDLEAAAFLSMDETTFRERTEGTPLRRPGVAGLARNAALVLGNVGGRVHLPILQETASSHPSDVVRDAAVWAAARIRHRLPDSKSE